MGGEQGWGLFLGKLQLIFLFTSPSLRRLPVPWAAIFRLLLAVCFPPGMLSRFWELQLSLGQHERCCAFLSLLLHSPAMSWLCHPPAAALALGTRLRCPSEEHWHC